MKMNQIAETLEGALKAVYGEEAITSTNLEGLIAEGTKLIADGVGFDNIYNALLDRVRLMVVPSGEYVPDTYGLLRDYATYGAIVEKVYYEPIESQDNASWKPVKNGDTDDPFKITLNQVDVNLYSTRTTFEVPYSWQEVQIKTAFTSESEMVKFIEGLFQNARNSFNVKVETVSRWVISNFIAEKIKYSGTTGVTGLHVVKLLTEYNTAYNTSLTPAQALTDTDFLQYVVMRISNIRDLMRPMNQLYNTKNYKRFTPPAMQKMCFLSAFSNAIATHLYSNTWHEEYVKLPEFTSIPYWQGTGTSGQWDEISKIDVVPSSGGDEIAAINIVGIIYDEQAMGITTWDMKTTAIYNPHNEWNNAWIKGDMGLFNDLSENAVVFTLN